MGDDRGSGSVLALAGVAVIGASAIGLLGIGAATVTRARAAAAADAAALAAAGTALTDPAAACTQGRTVASLDGASVLSCQVRGSVVDVEVTVPAPRWLRWAGSARLNARAGPTETYQEQPGRGGNAS